MEWWQALLLVQAAGCSAYVALAVASNQARERRQRQLMQRAASDNAQPITRPKADPRVQRRRHR